MEGKVIKAGGVQRDDKGLKASRVRIENKVLNASRYLHMYVGTYRYSTEYIYIHMYSTL